MLRQTQQEEDENLRHELDNELDSIRSLLFTAPPAPGPSTESKASAPIPDTHTPDNQDKEYDQYVRELALDRRAKPKDRTKAEEEVALEEKEVLEKAERRRLRRMNGEESESDEANETDALADGSPTKAHAGHTPAKSAAHEMSEKMLQHFDRGNVTSFRRNQNRYRDIARLPDDPALRASTSRPVRTGASADAIITPMRKKKRAKDPDTLQPRASPLARKSGPISKRSKVFPPRSVDINLLQ